MLGASAKHHRAKPEDPAGGVVSRESRALALAAVIRKPMVTTDPLVCDGVDASLLGWW